MEACGTQFFCRSLTKSFTLRIQRDRRDFCLGIVPVRSSYKMDNQMINETSAARQLRRSNKGYSLVPLTQAAGNRSVVPACAAVVTKSPRSGQQQARVPELTSRGEAYQGTEPAAGLASGDEDGSREGEGSKEGEGCSVGEAVGFTVAVIWGVAMTVGLGEAQPASKASARAIIMPRSRSLFFIISSFLSSPYRMDGQKQKKTSTTHGLWRPNIGNSFY